MGKPTMRAVSVVLVGSPSGIEKGKCKGFKAFGTEGQKECGRKGVAEGKKRVFQGKGCAKEERVCQERNGVSRREGQGGLLCTHYFSVLFLEGKVSRCG